MPPPLRKSKAPRTEEFLRVRDRELELKRLSGEISCSECRRLKLKCDKKIPCVQCERRGCSQICPTGRRQPIDGGQRTRTTQVAEQDRIQAHIGALSERVRLLEDALQAERDAHGIHETHPLLRRELQAIKEKAFLEDNSAGAQLDEETIHEFGTLTISEGHSMQYIGASAIENNILMEVLGRQNTKFDTSSSTSSEHTRATESWPFLSTARQDGTLGPGLVSELPPFIRANILFEFYLINVAWVASPVLREQIYNDLVPLFYPNGIPVSPSSLKHEHMGDLALLFILLACGTIGDFTQPPKNPEGERYSHLARAALGSQDVLSETSLTVVQAVSLLAVYETGAWHKSALEKSWKLNAVANDLAISIGLHRDPSRWNLSSVIIERRRKLFWELFDFDIWRSIEFGRPPSFPMASVDCELPPDTEAMVDENGDVVESVWQWRYRFSRDIMYKVAEQMCSVQPLKFRDVLLLDKKIRGFPLHPFVTKPLKKRPELGLEWHLKSLHPIVTSWYRESILLLIHHNFFAKAILDSPSDPRRGSFAASFLAAYRSASFLINMTYSNYRVTKYFILRIWSVWSILIVSAIIVGSVASLGSIESFATSAFVDLELAIKLFSEADHAITKNALPLLYRLKERAHRALSNQRIDHPSDTIGKKEQPDDQGLFDELQLLHRPTRVIDDRKSPSAASTSSSNPSANSPSSIPTPPQLLGETIQEEQPTPYPSPSDGLYIHNRTDLNFPLQGHMSQKGSELLALGQHDLRVTSISGIVSGISGPSTHSSPPTDGPSTMNNIALMHGFEGIGHIPPVLGSGTHLPLEKDHQVQNMGLPWLEHVSNNIPLEKLYSQGNVADFAKLGLFNLPEDVPTDLPFQDNSFFEQIMSDPILTSVLNDALDSIGTNNCAMETASEDVWQSLMSQSGFAEQSPLHSSSETTHQDGQEHGIHLLNGLLGVYE